MASEVKVTYNYGYSKRFKVQIFRGGRITHTEFFFTKSKAMEWIEMNAGKLPVVDLTVQDKPVKTTFS